MSSSLQEQLLKAGLVTEQQVEEARRTETRPARGGKGAGGAKARGAGGKVRGAGGKARTRGPRRRDGPQGGQGGQGRQGGPRGQGGQGEAPAAPPAAAKRKAPVDKRRLRQRVRALLARRALTAPDGETPYNFVRGKRVKRLYVNESLRTRLLAGELVIAEVYGLHHVLDAAALGALLDLLPETFVHRHGEEAPAAGSGAEPPAAAPDEYAGYEVPDDLIW